MASMSSWMRSVWLYCRMARPTRKIISKPCTHHTTVRCIDSAGLCRRLSFRERASFISYLVHENVKDARGYRQREEGEEEGEEPWRGVHGRVETLRSKMDVQLWQLLLRWKRIDFNCTYVNGARRKKKEKKKDVPPPCGQCFHCRFDGLGCGLKEASPAADTQTGRCRVQARPCWVWRAPSGGTPASGAQTRRRPPPRASGSRADACVSGLRSRDRNWIKFSLDSSNSHFDRIKKFKATNLTGKWLKYQFY